MPRSAGPRRPRNAGARCHPGTGPACCAGSRPPWTPTSKSWRAWRWRGPAIPSGGCARQVKRLTLERGGKSANIVLADADLERAAATAPYAVFDNAGQDCCARSRILVQRSVLDRFMELLEPAVKNVAVGDPASPGTQMGPLISAAHRQHVASYVPGGAAAAFRGSAADGPGFWFPPAVLAPVRADDRGYTDDVFGPVVTVTPFEDEADAVSIANETPYGRAGSIWTRDE